ncbi:Small integral membrane protein 15 [Caenorhabditis elegans]|uniref:Small integral membrane protein 15 n=1 Tax=Caenorhabditis elegans TaxID=6239 RepID=D7SFL9_CAEEL|nr:Small integral membrane protein 15 [Caenorhabditis elegans]CBM41215.1 Small integral membrane protein 15 [Caenorhabditis elegans]|eukprot:NP_001254146.1 Uncharacterized protein CELE_M110.10 [Caenorhabditis elegans]
MNNIRNQFQKLYWMILDHPFYTVESVLALTIPLILVVFMFNWRVKQSMKKQKLIQSRRDKLLKKLNGGKTKMDENEEDDEVIKEAIKLMEQKVKKSN